MKTRLIAIGLALTALLIAAPSAAAQGPVRSETLYAGAYRLRVDLYSDPPFAGRRYDFDVLVSTGIASGLHGVSLRATAVPDVSTNATSVNAVITPAGSVGGFKGYASMPVRGAWRLRFMIGGPAGSNAVDLPLQVAAPTAIPIWAAWAIGLAPLLGLLGFAIQQRAYLTRLQRQASGAPPVASVLVAT